MSTPVQTLIGKFVWHENYSDDVEAAKKFYADLFGWDFEKWEAGELDYSMVKVGERMHAGFLVAQGGAPAHWLGIVQVEDCNETAKKVEAAGGKIFAGPLDIPEVGRFVVIGDPQGAAVAALSPAGDTADQPPAEGVFVWDELQTSDIEGAKRFYGEVFGWTTADMDMGPNGTYTILRRAGDIDVAGGMQLQEGNPAPPHWLVYVYADDVDGTASRSSELGGTTLLEPVDVPEVGRLAVLQDPQGAVFGLFKASAQ